MTRAIGRRYQEQNHVISSTPQSISPVRTYAGPIRRIVSEKEHQWIAARTRVGRSPWPVHVAPSARRRDVLLGVWTSCKSWSSVIEFELWIASSSRLSSSSLRSTTLCACPDDECEKKSVVFSTWACRVVRRIVSPPFLHPTRSFPSTTCERRSSSFKLSTSFPSLGRTVCRYTVSSAATAIQMQVGGHCENSDRSEGLGCAAMTPKLLELIYQPHASSCSQ